MTTAAPPQTWLPVIIENIPHGLTDDPSWYPGLITPRVGKPGKWNKQPANPETAKLAEWSDPTTRCTFSDAYMAYQRDPRFKCIGYMLHDSGITGIDLDDAFEPGGSIKPWAQEIVDAIPGYWERSVSGTGLRGFCKAVLPPGRRKRTCNGSSIEIYDDVRFLVLTGHAIRAVDELPDLQAEIDAVHAQWFAGVGAENGAIAVGGKGPAATVTPEGMAILTRMMSGRWAEQMGAIWDKPGDSDDDWKLAGEAVYWAIQLGHSGDTLGQVVEDVMRAGPWRSKWDRPWTVTVDGKTIQTTYLGVTIGKQIKAVQKRLAESKAKYPDFSLDDADEAASDELRANETPEQTIARQLHELAQARTLLAQQKTIIRGERADRLAAVETVRRIGDVLAIPTERLAPAAKILTIVTLMEAHSRASRGQEKLPAVVLSERSGMPINTVSNYVQDLAARDGSPIDRRVTRDWVTDDLGEQRPITVSLVAPRFDTLNESLAAVLTMGGPSDKAQQKKEQAKARAEASLKARLAARGGGFGWCEDHENDTVNVKGYCPDCGEVVGDRTVSVEEFRALNHEIQDSGSAPPPVDVRTKGHAFCDSADTTHAPAPSEILNRALRDSAPTPIRLGPQRPAPWRCPCGSMERFPRPGGGYRCDGCGATGGTFVPSSEWQVIPDGYPCPSGGEFRMDFATGQNWGRWPRLAAVSGGAE